MNSINPIEFIDSLAEVTRYSDRSIIERSLLTALKELMPKSDFWLYRLMTKIPPYTLSLLSYSKHGVLGVNSVQQLKKGKFPESLQEAIDRCIQTLEIQSLKKPDESDYYYMVYPAIDENKEIFSILIQGSRKLNLNTQRLTHGMLRVYCNYLRLLDKTQRDKLTNLLNRETMDDEITRILVNNNETNPAKHEYANFEKDDARQNKGVYHYWLGVLDVDHFKNINDTFGHLYGDEILILIARLMEQNVRDGDLIFRYGGEEFVILLRAFDMDDAIYAFERIRQSINQHKYAKVESLTISVGITQITHQPSSADVFMNADKALYYAKTHGRDQMHIYELLVNNGLLEEEEDKVEPGGIDFF